MYQQSTRRWSTSKVATASCAFILILASPLWVSRGAPAGEATASARYRVAAKATTSSLIVGKQLSVYGTVSPNAAGKRVTLQRLSGGRWTNLASAGINKSSRYAFYYRLTTPGTNRLRVYKAADRGYTAGVSNTLNVAVYRWRYLTSVKPVDYEVWYRYGPLQMNGVTYAKTVILEFTSYWSDAYIEYNLSRRCTQLATAVGQSDTDRTAGMFAVEASGDSALLWSGTVTLGQIRAVSIPIKGYLRLRLDATNTSASDSDKDLGFGNARILCSF